MNNLVDKFINIAGVDIPFLVETVMRNGVGAFTEYGDIIAKMNALASQPEVDYYEYGKVSAKLFEIIFDYTVSG